MKVVIIGGSMHFYFFSIALLSLIFSSLNADEKELPNEMLPIMHQPKYEHALWGIYVKDLQTGEILYDLNSNKLFSPASTTKLFSVAALLHAFGDDYRFKTPVYASGKIENGILDGDLILVAQGDLTMGGRQSQSDTISYTKLDHIVANEVPGVILTPEDPLNGLNQLAKQIWEKGIKEIKGNVIIDDSLFETTEKRGMTLSPIMINENLIDITINPTTLGNISQLTWRPQIDEYTVENQVKTVNQDEKLDIQITADDTGRRILVKGAIPLDQRNIIRTFPIKDPKFFARKAFTQALEQHGIKIQPSKKDSHKTLKELNDPQQVALWTSPPLTEYAKLILKVSHNLGADLIPLLLASQKEKITFGEGMLLMGDFVTKEVKISPEAFVFVDAAGGNENRLTPQTEIQLLDYLNKQSPRAFQNFYNALPILGVDGSLEDFGMHSPAAGKVRAKTGTGAALNLATQKFFLITQAYAGYIEGKNGHLLGYMVVVNNAAMPTIEDVFAIFEDESRLSNIIYENSEKK